MELVLQKDLKHQEDGVYSVRDVFEKVYIVKSNVFYANPEIPLGSQKLYENIKDIKKRNSIEDKSIRQNHDYLSLDIKMETGTGKTYVYTKTIFELNKHYGFNKFIILVPSLAIKAGTSQFISDGYVKRHFRDVCGYNKEINLGVLNNTPKKNNKKNFFPSVVTDFVKGSCQNSNKIYVLLVNGQLITNGKLLKGNYDKDVEGFYIPFEALKATKPILIVDEPHRFPVNKTTFTETIENIKPQCVIRYGATFPEISEGKGKNKVTKKDYCNLVYDLNANASFSQGLIKGVTKEHFEPVSKKEEKVKITSITDKDSVNFLYSKKDSVSKLYTLKKDDSLSIINENFGNISISGISKNSVIFSNGLEKHSGEVMNVDIYMSSYQESMMWLALKRHFETERENFCSRNYKIKTLALFFIDDISSYRITDEKKPYLLETFEKLLRERINETIKELPEAEKEYREYLQASLADVSKCHAGYFSQDNSDSSNEIAEEVNLILNGKKELLSFKNPDGTYNCRRFLFSKWTLKEGWDNPNVFTIAKLRSSGSENSKLQEVGRGLRLPVDERGNRISNEDFKLNYIVDFTEADFANKLVAEINEGLPNVTSLTLEKIEEVAKNRSLSREELFIQLITKKYIDIERNVISENRLSFLEEYPEFDTVANNKIKDRNKTKPNNVKINKKAFDRLKNLWLILNQKYLLSYETELENILEKDIVEIFEDNVFTDVWINSDRKVLTLDSDKHEFIVEESTGVAFSLTGKNILSYSEFLKNISKATNISIVSLHKALCEYANKHGNEFTQKFNAVSVSNFIERFSKWKAKTIQAHFKYIKCNIDVGATALTEKNGSVREFVAQGNIGTKIVKGTPSEKYLYEKFAYDSDLEYKNISTGEIKSVVVYGKIPRRSVAIPTFLGENYSPDFMYVVKRENGIEDLNLIVETKDVNEDDLRAKEKLKITCAKVFFENLKNEGYKVFFKKQIKKEDMGKIIEKVVLSDN